MIYFLQPTAGGPVKIGHAADVDRRRVQLEAHYGQPLALLATLPGGRDEERLIHQRFEHLRLGRTEQFRPGPDLLAFLGRPILVDQDPNIVEAMTSLGLKRLVQLDLDPNLHRLLRAVAGVNGMSMVAYVRQFLEQHLREEAKRKGIRL